MVSIPRLWHSSWKRMSPPRAPLAKPIASALAVDLVDLTRDPLARPVFKRRRKTWRLPIRKVDHVAGEEEGYWHGNSLRWEQRVRRHTVPSISTLPRAPAPRSNCGRKMHTTSRCSIC